MQQLDHATIVKLVSDLVRSVVLPGEFSLRIAANHLVLVCHGVSRDLRAAWEAMDAHFTDEQREGYLLTMHSMLVAQGRFSTLQVVNDGVSTPMHARMESVPIWLPSEVVTDLRKFAVGINQPINEAATLLLLSGLQIRQFIGGVRQGA